MRFNIKSPRIIENVYYFLIPLRF